MAEVSDRLDQLRSFIWWTAPLYVIFAATGLYESHFAMSLAFAALVAVLAAFGLLDGFILLNLQAVRAQLSREPEEIYSAKSRLERLSRTVLLGGAAFGAAGVVAVVLLALG